MKNLLTICLFTAGISAAAFAIAEVPSSEDWQSQVEAPTVEISDSETKQTNLPIINEPLVVEIPEGNDMNEVVVLGVQMLEAIQAGKIQLVMGLLLMILIWTLRSFWSSFPPDAVPWITAGIAVLGSAAVGMTSGWPWERILADALAISTSAGGLWSLIGKHISSLAKK